MKATIHQARRLRLATALPLARCVRILERLEEEDRSARSRGQIKRRAEQLCFENRPLSPEEVSAGFAEAKAHIQQSMKSNP